MQQQINLNKNVNIEFTPQQLQIVIALLTKGVIINNPLTHEQTGSVINIIETQVVAQLQEPKETLKEEKLKKAS